MKRTGVVLRCKQTLLVLQLRVVCSSSFCSASKRLYSSSSSTRTSSNVIPTLPIPGKDYDSININDMVFYVEQPKTSENVPFISNDCFSLIQSNSDSPDALVWLLQKEILKQDALIVAPPSSAAVPLILYFASLLRREVEHVPLSRDTTDSDLRQRREIVYNNDKQMTVHFVNQSVVKAATEGRLLILESIEKAEPNVLPLLNNLLENREMPLEDGSFLIPAERFNQLSSKSSKTHQKWLKVHPNFRIIAITSPPSPSQYKKSLSLKHIGNPLDPPLRSRFQIRNFYNLNTPSKLLLLRIFSNQHQLSIPQDVQTKIISICESISQLPHQISSSLSNLSQIHEVSDRCFMSLLQLIKNHYRKSPTSTNPPLRTYFNKVYPHKLLYPRPNFSSLVDAIESILSQCIPQSSTQQESATQKCALKSIIEDLVFLQKDIAIISSRGSGKTHFIHETLLPELTKHKIYNIVTMAMYADIPIRDLFQTRRTNPITGNTEWHLSPLVQAAIDGSICVLDSIERLPVGTLSVLSSFLLDRSITLYDGTKLVPLQQFNELTSHLQNKEEKLEYSRTTKLFAVHESFRVILAGDKPTSLKPYIGEDMLGVFNFHTLSDPTFEEELQIVSGHLKSVPDEVSESFLKARTKLLHQIVKTCREIRSRIKEFGLPAYSLRQSIRSARKIIDLYQNPRTVILNSCLSSLLPTSIQKPLSSLISNNIISYNTLSDFPQQQSAADPLRSTSKPPEEQDKDLVPFVPIYYGIEEQNTLMSQIQSDLQNNEFVLLLGTQGVGKNKIVDQLLLSGRAPRQYIQLHRDFSVSQFLMKPNIVQNQIVFEPSPLITAMIYGHTCVVDEVDKASNEVVCILKSIIDGDVLLPNGERLVSKTKLENMKGEKERQNKRQIHEDFRMIVIGNRPGYPFLGNDFWRENGDWWSVYLVSNPGSDSRMEILKKYAGGNVDPKLLSLISAGFDKIESSKQSYYPYGLREIISIVKHLSAFPSTPLFTALRNVFDLDLYSSSSSSSNHTNTNSLFYKLLSKYFSLSNTASNPIPFSISVNSSTPRNPASNPKTGKIYPNNTPHVGGNTWYGGTGGSDTAGLGGVGGPYRFDSGNPVYQVSDDIKNNLSEEIKKLARKVGDQEREKRLKEIGVSESERKYYETILDKVAKEVKEVKDIFRYLKVKKGKKKEDGSRRAREWKKGTEEGEIDENRMVDICVGEKNVFKSRVFAPLNQNWWNKLKNQRQSLKGQDAKQEETEQEGEQSKEKDREEEEDDEEDEEEEMEVEIVVDVSGSMYRFNGLDGRLNRMKESVVVLMEGLEGELDYSIVGHSGDSDRIELLHRRRKESRELTWRDKLEVIRKMEIEAQFCDSGDNTLEAMSRAVSRMKDRQRKKQGRGGEGLVIVLSDANIRRYGIGVQELKQAMGELQSGDDYDQPVKCILVFIASLFGNEAEVMSTQLPPGTSYVCMNTSELPQTIRQILIHHLK